LSRTACKSRAKVASAHADRFALGDHRCRRAPAASIIQAPLACQLAHQNCRSCAPLAADGLDAQASIFHRLGTNAIDLVDVKRPDAVCTSAAWTIEMPLGLSNSLAILASSLFGHANEQVRPFF
jgi:hypothetical protein